MKFTVFERLILTSAIAFEISHETFELISVLTVQTVQNLSKF